MTALTGEIDGNARRVRPGVPARMPCATARDRRRPPPPPVLAPGRAVERTADGGALAASPVGSTNPPRERARPRCRRGSVVPSIGCGLPHTLASVISTSSFGRRLLRLGVEATCCGPLDGRRQVAARLKADHVEGSVRLDVHRERGRPLAADLRSSGRRHSAHARPGRSGSSLASTRRSKIVVTARSPSDDRRWSPASCTDVASKPCSTSRDRAVPNGGRLASVRRRRRLGLRLPGSRVG